MLPALVPELIARGFPSTLSAEEHAMQLPPEGAGYRRKDHLSRQRQFIVAKPDGDLQRAVGRQGKRPAEQPHAL